MTEFFSGYQRDVFATAMGELEIFFIGHGTLAMRLGKFIIHIDPVSEEGDYSKLPAADLILITHEHTDHLDTVAIEQVTSAKTAIICNASSAKDLKTPVILANGDSVVVAGIRIESIPAYNTSPGREKFHPRHRDNGYLLTLGDFRVYIAGDTEDIPEMKQLSAIDIAFLPVNQPYTMTPEQAAAAANAFKPAILYPYHYGETDVTAIKPLLDSGITLEIRQLR